MEDQKIENVLNLAIETPEKEREKSLELNVGYDAETARWEVIVRYSGSTASWRERGIGVTELSGGYAIASLNSQDIIWLSKQPGVEYLEKPKEVYFSVFQGKSVSCIQPLQIGKEALKGKGVLIAVIDSGVDYAHQDFLDDNGRSRILYLWDQTQPGNPPEGFNQGSEYTAEQLTEAAAAPSLTQRYRIVPSRDANGHGTAVLGIAAGNGRASGGRYAGVAPEADILVVKMGQALPQGFPRTTQLMEAVDYVIRKARELNRPVAVNLSFGNTYGSHDGRTLVETFLDEMAGQWENIIVVGTGNEGAARGHAAGALKMGEVREVKMEVGDPETAMNVQLWKSYVDQFDILLISPSGKVLGPLQTRPQKQEYEAGNTRILVYYGEPSPYSIAQEVYFSMIPIEGEFIDSGEWTFRLIPRRLVTGGYDLWLPSSQALNRSTGFAASSPDITLTIPSAADQVIAVGAYDSRRDIYADFSGRGYTRERRQIKPDLAAPGVNVMAPLAGGGYAPVTGTSFAAPFVTGSGALLMEWGIADGHDPYLYGEKVKAFLRRGARELPGYPMYPNRQLGFGALCVKDSLPE